MENTPVRPDGEIERIVDEYASALFRMCLVMLRSVPDAEDAVQDACAAAWQGRDGFDGENLRAWLYRITGNRCLDMLRRRGLLTFDELREETAAGPEEGGDGFSDTTMRALGRLSAADRAVVLLRVREELSYAEIAERLGENEAALRKRYERAKKRLARYLTEAESEVS